MPSLYELASSPAGPQSTFWDKLQQTWPAKLAKSGLAALALPGDVYAGRVDPLSDEAIGRSTDLAGLAMLGTTGAPMGALGSGFIRPKPATVAAPEGIRAYHGSPHDFDKFDLGKIGTGEGAQSYGHGLYFAENPAVAGQYERKLGRDADAFKVNGRITEYPSPEFAAAKLVQEFEEHPAAIAARLPAGNPAYADVKAVLESWAQEMPALVPGRGKMYEVNLRAKPEEFLDWDKPIAGQSPHIQDVMKSLGVKQTEDFPLLSNRIGGPLIPNVKPNYGADAYREAGTNIRGYEDAWNWAQTATKRLDDAGIPGLRYLDQGSRAEGKGTSNYVVFNPEIIDILKKYGWAGLGAPAAAAQFSQEQPQDF